MSYVRYFLGGFLLAQAAIIAGVRDLTDVLLFSACVLAVFTLFDFDGWGGRS